MGRTQSNSLATRHARDKAGARHGKGELASTLLRPFGSGHRCVHAGEE